MLVGNVMRPNAVDCGAAEGTAVASLPVYENYTGATYLRAAVPCDLTAVDAYKDYKTGITSPGPFLLMRPRKRKLPPAAGLWQSPQPEIIFCFDFITQEW